MIKELLNNNYKKVDTTIGGGLVKVILFNIEKKDIKYIIVDDYEYQCVTDSPFWNEESIETLDSLRIMDIDKKANYEYRKINNDVRIGDTIEVVKGRKYTKGSKGKVVKVYDYRDRYKRYVATYCITDNDMIININNIKII